MKKQIISAAVLACALFSAACAQPAGGEDAPSVTLLAGDGERVVLRAEETDTSASLFDALAALQEKGELRFSYEEGEYGAFLTQINGHTAAGNEFWAVYTTLGEYGGVRYSDEAYGTYHYGETQLASASYGVSSLPLVEGMLYAVALSSY